MGLEKKIVYTPQTDSLKYSAKEFELYSVCGWKQQVAFEPNSDAITVTHQEGYSGGTRQSAVAGGWEPGQGAVATIQVKGAKDLLGGSRDREKRADGDTFQKWS